MVLQKCVNLILYNQYFIFVVKDIFFCDCQMLLINTYKIIDLFCEKGPGGSMS
jgi:hypothetical protein